MFNTAWTDLVLKVGGQILLAVLVILVITFGADPLPPKKNTEEMIASRSEQPLKTNAAAAEQKTNATPAKTNIAVEQKNAAAQTNTQVSKPTVTTGAQTNTVLKSNNVTKPKHFSWQK